MASSKKDVIYIESDDDITAVIDRVNSSKGSILALVLPKRYATLKSSVNMKLLKKTSDKKKSKLVLITDDPALLPLAGATGVHVADSLKSRPRLPAVPVVAAAAASSAIEDDKDDTKSDDDTESEIIDGDEPLKASDKSDHIKSIKGSKRIRVPNFGRFRTKMVLGVVAILLLFGGWFWAFKIAPKAEGTIYAQTSRVVTKFDASLNPAAKTNNIEKKVLKGEAKEISKTVTERFKATGEKDVGKKASGTMTVQNCDSSDTVTIPSGTSFSDNVTGLNFVSSSAVDVPGGSFGGGECTAPGEADVTVVASSGGDNHNLSPRSYSVSGVGSLINGFGGAMSGGTSEIVKIVTAADISGAKQALLNGGDDSIKTQLAAEFSQNTILLEDTFSVTNTNPVSSVKAGAEADEASVSAEFTYTVIGIPKDIMEILLEQEQAKQIDSDQLTILDTGVDDVRVDVGKKKDDGVYPLVINTVGHAGPEIDLEALKVEISGMRFSEAAEFIEAKPGVKQVDLLLTPFWVFSVPGPDKTTLVIEIDEGALQ